MTRNIHLSITQCLNIINNASWIFSALTPTHTNVFVMTCKNRKVKFGNAVFSNV